ncbi:hypothetical protein V6N13_023594 [Hibiscus sabdariffa]|uniref:Secreted protein n=1 Tax=Hibiscus sabdariffa TaxID=183260 RepID=A0ABR2PM95_9ROSI
MCGRRRGMGSTFPGVSLGALCAGCVPSLNSSPPQLCLSLHSLGKTKSTPHGVWGHGMILMLHGMMFMLHDTHEHSSRDSSKHNLNETPLLTATGVLAKFRHEGVCHGVMIRP